jgi:hypothetical protein
MKFHHRMPVSPLAFRRAAILLMGSNPLLLKHKGSVRTCVSQLQPKSGAMRFSPLIFLGMGSPAAGMVAEFWVRAKIHSRRVSDACAQAKCLPFSGGSALRASPLHRAKGTLPAATTKASKYKCLFSQQTSFGLSVK